MKSIMNCVIVSIFCAAAGVVFGAAPSNVAVRQIPNQLHVTWTDNSTDEYYFSLECRRTPFPGTWSEIAQIAANHISYQFDSPLNGYTYAFRLRAVSEFGYSDYSNTASVTVGTVLFAMRLNQPNGEKPLVVEGVYPITWGNYYNPPSLVNLYYSLDGGTSWTAIKTNYPNTGEYFWKLPPVTTSECVVKIADPGNSNSYDLTNTAFAIEGYDFDMPGGAQGWTVSDVYDEDGYSIDAGFRFNWRDPVDYPTRPGSDPLNNRQGTIAIVKDTAGIIYSNLENMLAQYWYQDVISPDLTTLDYWQRSTGVRVRIAHCMATNANLYCNLIIHVYDTDSGTNRYFTYPVSASELSYCDYGTTNVWNTRTILFENLSGFPAHYTLKRITIRIWGDLGYSYGEEEDGSVFIDDIFPLHRAMDYDCDGDIDLSDFSALSTAWGTSTSSPTWNSVFDPYDSGLIDIYEIQNFVNDWLDGI